MLNIQLLIELNQARFIKKIKFIFCLQKKAYFSINIKLICDFSCFVFNKFMLFCKIFFALFYKAICTLLKKIIIFLMGLKN